jgi:hypothetical protein
MDASIVEVRVELPAVMSTTEPWQFAPKDASGVSFLGATSGYREHLRSVGSNAMRRSRLWCAYAPGGGPSTRSPMPNMPGMTGHSNGQETALQALGLVQWNGLTPDLVGAPSPAVQMQTNMGQPMTNSMQNCMFNGQYEMPWSPQFPAAVSPQMHGVLPDPSQQHAWGGMAASWGPFVGQAMVPPPPPMPAAPLPPPGPPLLPLAAAMPTTATPPGAASPPTCGFLQPQAQNPQALLQPCNDGAAMLSMLMPGAPFCGAGNNGTFSGAQAAEMAEQLRAAAAACGTYED